MKRKAALTGSLFLYHSGLNLFFKDQFMVFGIY